MPTLVVVGDEDVLTPPPDAERLAEGIAGARLERLALAGHLSASSSPRRSTACSPTSSPASERARRERTHDRWICSSPTKSPSSPARAAGSAWRARGRSSRKAAACASARAARRRLADAARRGRCGRSPAEHDAHGAGGRVDRGRRRAGRSTARSRRFGGLDILVNNVGLARRRRHLLDTTDAEWQAAFDETLFPAIRASRLAVPHMQARGGGAIVMIASICGRESGGRMTYNAVKAAEISLAKALAQQLAPRQHPRQQRRARLDPLSRRLVAQAAAGRSRRGSPSSSGASCRSAASAAPTKSAPSSRSSPRRARAGSAARRSSSTAASRGRTSEP